MSIPPTSTDGVFGIERLRGLSPVSNPLKRRIQLSRKTAICARARYNKRKRSFGMMIIAALAAVALASLAACAAPPTPTPQFTLRIGTLPVLTYLPYFVMQEHGFAKQNALEFAETPYPAAAAIIKAM